MASLTEDIATWLYRHLRDQGLVESAGQWSNLTFERKEQYRALAVGLMDMVAHKAGEPVEHVHVPEGMVRVHGYLRRRNPGEGRHAGGSGNPPEEP